MIDRRQAIACLGGALAFPASFTHAAPAAPAQVPPLSTAELGAAVAVGWRHQTLPKVERANQFAIVSDQGTRVLQVSSSASASSWVAPVDLDPAAQPWLHWRWKVSRSVPGSDLRRKAGDDYAARLYVFFALANERLSLPDRLRIQAARVLSGAEVPAAALCYVWGHAQAAGSSGWNPYTDRVRMVVADSGDAHAGQWRSHVRDINRDWADAFGGEVPRISGLALTADTDNTGERVEAWFGDARFASAR